MPVQTLFIANRGEIAARIIRTARERGVKTVLGVSEADEGSYPASLADAVVVIGPAPAAKSYLNVEAVVAAAQEAGADAVHPGYGFLSENAGFAEAVEAAGLTWVGPSAETIRLMGDKSAARETAKKAGVPVLPGTEGSLPVDADPLEAAREIGFPLMVKASAGGGGKGIRVVRSEDELAAGVDAARAEAGSIFGDSAVYLERFVDRARHVEVQVLGDGERFVHVGDRDCSLQRRSQKVIEEAPAPDLPEDVRETIRTSSVELARATGYRGAGTVEFLYDPASREAFFIEMNTRLQVEHPVTEMVTGLDLVAEQLRAAAGEGLSVRQEDIRLEGHALEFRLNAEDPDNGFFPSPGTVSGLAWPEGEGIRVDSGIAEGSVVAPFYDSMIAKLIVWAPSREEAIASAEEALRATRVEGIATTVPLHLRALRTREFASVGHWTTFLESMPAGAGADSDDDGAGAEETDTADTDTAAEEAR